MSEANYPLYVFAKVPLKEPLPTIGGVAMTTPENPERGFLLAKLMPITDEKQSLGLNTIEVGKCLTN